jgi:Domain of unknown function (DUF4145)
LGIQDLEAVDLAGPRPRIAPSVKCPHCFIDFHDEWVEIAIGQDSDRVDWTVSTTPCTSCGKLTIDLVSDHVLDTAHARRVRIWPRGSVRPVAPEVPQGYAESFRTACELLDVSPEASAAFSRRCLQALLRREAGAKPGRLVDEIDFVVDNGNLPSRLSENLHVVREIGNLGSHETENKNARPGEIVPVEPAEAEWLVEVLEGLFDHYFVTPERDKSRRATLAKKLKAAGRKPIGFRDEKEAKEQDADNPSEDGPGSA